MPRKRTEAQYLADAARHARTSGISFGRAAAAAADLGRRRVEAARVAMKRGR